MPLRSCVVCSFMRTHIDYRTQCDRCMRILAAWWRGAGIKIEIFYCIYKWQWASLNFFSKMTNSGVIYTFVVASSHSRAKWIIVSANWMHSIEHVFVYIRHQHSQNLINKNIWIPYNSHKKAIHCRKCDFDGCQIQTKTQFTHRDSMCRLIEPLWDRMWSNVAFCILHSMQLTKTFYTIIVGTYFPRFRFDKLFNIDAVTHVCDNSGNNFFTTHSI